MPEGPTCFAKAIVKSPVPQHKSKAKSPASTFNSLKNFFRQPFRGDEDIDGQRKLNKILNKLHEQKEISDREYSMMEGILEFEEKMAREVMVPRTDAFMVDINDSFQENLDKILKEPYSRVPVYDGDKDKIVGVIHIRTVLRKAHKVGFDKLDYDQVMYKHLYFA